MVLRRFNQYPTNHCRGHEKWTPQPEMKTVRRDIDFVLSIHDFFYLQHNMVIIVVTVADVRVFFIKRIRSSPCL